MAEKQKKEMNPINVNSSDSEDENKGQEKEEELDLPLEKLNLGPRKKLLVMNINGLLVHRTSGKERVIKSRRADCRSGSYYVFKRPFSEEFMKFCMERFEVGIWTSTQEHNIHGVLDCSIGTLKNKLLFIWDQDECTNPGFRSLENKYKPLYLKEMRKVWDNIGGPYDASNTMLIDDKPYKALLNPDNTAIFPHPYNPADEADNALGECYISTCLSKGELCGYLEGLGEASDVESYVKDHPFGQPPITASHPDWTFYSNVRQCLRNKGH